MEAWLPFIGFGLALATLAGVGWIMWHDARRRRP